MALGQRSSWIANKLPVFQCGLWQVPRALGWPLADVTGVKQSLF